MHSSNRPALYGITRDNSSRHGSDLWGKNQFNSTFPLALCLYMRDNGLDPVAVVSKEGKIKAVDDVWSMSEVVGRKEDSPHFHFEESFDPYVQFSRNQVDHIDLVVAVDGKHSIPLEVKLTVVPDNSTSTKEDKDWAPEMVMRPVSSAHAMMGVASSLMDPKNEETKSSVIDVLRPAYNKISTWTNVTENLSKLHLPFTCFSKDWSNCREDTETLFTPADLENQGPVS